jgi:hypothetical protein
VANSCNPATREAEIEKITVQSQSGQNVNETPISTSKLGMVVHFYISQQYSRHSGRIVVPGQQRQKHETLFENNLKQKGPGV